jgi:hypothetical protein
MFLYDVNNVRIEFVDRVAAADEGVELSADGDCGRGHSAGRLLGPGTAQRADQTVLQELHLRAADSVPHLAKGSHRGQLRLLAQYDFSQKVKNSKKRPLSGYSVSLEFEIKSNIFGYFQRLLVNLSLPRRSTNPLDKALAKQDADFLHKSGGKFKIMFGKTSINSGRWQVAIKRLSSGYLPRAVSSISALCLPSIRKPAAFPLRRPSRVSSIGR